MGSLRGVGVRLQRFVLVILAAFLAIAAITLAIGIGSRFVGASVLAQSASAHPMDALTAAEYALTKQVLTTAGHIDADSRFPLITLHEPPKATVLAWQPGDPTPRSAFAIVKQC